MFIVFNTFTKRAIRICSSESEAWLITKGQYGLSYKRFE